MKDDDDDIKQEEKEVVMSTSGSTVHYSASPNGPFVPLLNTSYPGCNNPSPFLAPNGTVFVLCTWTLYRTVNPWDVAGDWVKVSSVSPPSKSGLQDDDDDDDDIA